MLAQRTLNAPDTAVGSFTKTEKDRFKKKKYKRTRVSATYDCVMDKDRERERYVGVAPPTLPVPLNDLFAKECWLLFFNRSSLDCFLED